MLAAIRRASSVVSSLAARHGSSRHWRNIRPSPPPHPSRQIAGQPKYHGLVRGRSAGDVSVPSDSVAGLDHVTRQEMRPRERVGRGPKLEDGLTHYVVWPQIVHGNRHGDRQLLRIHHHVSDGQGAAGRNFVEELLNWIMRPPLDLVAGRDAASNIDNDRALHRNVPGFVVHYLVSSAVCLHPGLNLASLAG